MRFYIKTPDIDIGGLSENSEFEISHEIKREKIDGVVNIQLDPESILWGWHDEDTEYPQSCDQLIVSFIGIANADLSELDFLEIVYFVIADVLENFFDYLQINLGQYWVDVGFIRDWGLSTFLLNTNAKWVIEDEEKDISPFTIASAPSKFREYPEYSAGLGIKQIFDLESHLVENKFDFSQRLFANAKRQFVHGDYMLSSILAITALEPTLEKFVKNKCVARGISKNTISSYEHNHYISDYLKILLPLALEKDELSEWLKKEFALHNWGDSYNQNQILEWAVKLNQARNKAVHEGKKPDYETLDRGIFAAEVLYEFAKESISSIE